MAISRICSIPGCDKPARPNRQICSGHEHRIARYGDPNGGGPVVGLPAKHLEEVVLPYRGDDCLEWPFFRMPNGYGQITYKKKRSLVHRLVCELTNGPPLTDKRYVAAHNCGNAKCVNPAHIRWATQGENLDDRYVHGTMTIGERHGQSKLTIDDVKMIRCLLDNGFRQEAVGKRFGITPATVRGIKTRKNWGWLP